MPRLLLVDDNPSIHKIAETLLATSPIELVCVDSAAAALERIEKSEHFDVALVDTSMAGMDGWGLLARLREHPATARMPIAMMAGVLDTVDPERIKAAPIQGFLKKPVELRELGERVARLMETPVVLPEPVPEPPAAELPPPVPEPAAPEPPVQVPPPVPVSSFATMPATRLDDLPEYRLKEAARAAEADILDLTEEDLFPAGQPEPAPVPEETLDLEELDLDSLRGLSVPEPVAAEPAPIEPAAAEPLVAQDLFALEPGKEPSEPTPSILALPAEDLGAVPTLDRLPAGEAPAEVELPDLGVPAEELVDITTLEQLPEIGDLVPAGEAESPEISLAELLEEPSGTMAFTPPLPPLGESLDWSDESESLLPLVEAPAPSLQAEPLSLPVEETASAPTPLAEIPEPSVPFEPETFAVTPAMVPEAPIVPVPAQETTEAIVASAARETAEAPAEAPASHLEAAVPAAGSREALEALMADPVLMDALAKAVVARLGEQALREIAWEVMPELAERFPRS
jgi:CheY-like chemotaxis protein